MNIENLQHGIHPAVGNLFQEQHKFFQRQKTESSQTFSRRVFSRNAGQEPPGRAAEAKPWHRSPQQTPGFQEYLNPSSSSGPDPAEKSQSGFNNFPNSALTTPSYQYLPVFPNFFPAEVLNLEDPSNENTKHQHESPTGIQHSASVIPGQNFSSNNSSSGQALPELGNFSSDFNAIFQERVKDQAPLQDFKNHIHEDNRYQKSLW